jgi:hypothetical protein
MRYEQYYIATAMFHLQFSFCQPCLNLSEGEQKQNQREISLVSDMTHALFSPQLGAVKQHATAL